MSKHRMHIKYRMTCDRVNHKAATKGMFGKACSHCEHAGYHDTTGFWWEEEDEIVEVASFNELIKVMEEVPFIPGAEALFVTAHDEISSTEVTLRTSKKREPQIKPENKHLHKELVGGK